MHSTWTLLSALGDSSWLLPCTALIALVGGIGGWLPWSIVRRWMLATGLAALAVLASKIAFMGWGIGLARLDFTGFSGHAAMSAAVYPALLGWCCQAFDIRHRLWPGVLAGLVLALLTALSRVPLQAHSLSEVILGWCLGAAAVAWVLRRPGPPTRRAAVAGLLVIGLATAVLLRQMPLPSSHQIVVKLAQTISGREQLYQRMRS